MLKQPEQNDDKYFDVFVDYVLTGISSYNKEYTKDFGLSDSAIKHLKRARKMYPDVDLDKASTMPYLDELLSDKDFCEFLGALYYYIEGIKGTRESDKMKEHFKGLDIEGYFLWELQMYVQEFV